MKKKAAREAALWTVGTMEALSVAGMLEREEYPTTPDDEGGVGFSMTNDAVDAIMSIYSDIVGDPKPPGLAKRLSTGQPVLESCLIFATRMRPELPPSALYRFALVLGMMVVHEDEFEEAFG